MPRIGFYTQIVNERGTSGALFDYARHHQAAEPGGAVVLYNRNDPHNLPEALERARRQFDVIPCDRAEAVEAAGKAAGCEALYVIKVGWPDALMPKDLPMMVHAVFGKATSAVHGASYAFVSEWLSQFCTGGRVPFVPHICTIGSNDDDMRAELGIPEEAFVLGSYGGSTSFDVPFVRETIPALLEERSDLWLIFMNIPEFVAHPRVRFLPGSMDVAVKTAFINTSNAMLHARRIGETFGLAVGEFALRGKPVLTWSGSRDRAHLAMLGETALRYGNAEELIGLVARMTGNEPHAAEVYRRFTPEPVMAAFRDRLLEPALRNGPNGARQALGLKPWHALRFGLARAGLLK